MWKMNPKLHDIENAKAADKALKRILVILSSGCPPWPSLCPSPGWVWASTKRTLCLVFLIAFSALLVPCSPAQYPQAYCARHVALVSPAALCLSISRECVFSATGWADWPRQALRCWSRSPRCAFTGRCSRVHMG